jgi:peptidoglycan hydrolase-like protein with peptidoglycan-binding domain
VEFARLKSGQHRRVLAAPLRRAAVVLAGTLALGIALAAPASAGTVRPDAIGNLGPGSSGSQVETWQKDLNFFIHALNTCHPTLTVDGQYGPLTTNATKCFQTLQGDTVDGIEGPETRGSMCGFLFSNLTISGADALYVATCD